MSRKPSDLSSAFPDLAAAAAAQLPEGVVLDGEAVVWLDGRLDFDQLQHRMVSSPTAAARLAAEHPASFVAFDVLAAGGVDVRSRPWRERRLLLEIVAPTVSTRPSGCPRTPTTMRPRWNGSPTTPRSGWRGRSQGCRLAVPGRSARLVKVKSRTSMDAIIGAVIGPLEHPEALVVGRCTDGGELTIVGRTVPLSAGHAAAVAAVIVGAAAVGEHPWPEWIGSGHFGGSPIAISRVAPQVVVEVAADTALQAGRHRHALRLVRLRPDLTPDDVS
ncbi:ATP-dependent DNA ligase [Microlunatus ginsengisoli]|uniref:ATP-dependent DNA ligase family profile domain-containing protein n=1 Tax=Microlunatus ginsengisoli TaxID=363863 RepID=A0ABP7AZM6_9ACTN